MKNVITRADLPAHAAALLGASWLTLTLVNQHPNRAFDIGRRYDVTGMLIPNWRFFAPNPAVHDYRVGHRLIFADGSTSEWRETRQVSSRRPWSMFYFPARRRDKAVIDLVSGITEHMAHHLDRVVASVPYELLRGMVREVVREESLREKSQVVAFQFVIGRDAGVDESEDAQVFLASPREPLGGGSHD